MPAVLAPRQPDSRLERWFRLGPGRLLIADALRQSIPELTRVFGHTGLYLRPLAEVPEELSGNMLAQIISLHRDGSGFNGQLRCQDDCLPIAERSLSLVHALFVLESSPDPLALLQEFTRVLKPEGVVMLIILNSWSPTRLRWAIQGISGQAAAQAENLAREAGLEVLRRHHLGPVWARDRHGRSPDPHRRRMTDGLRAVSLLVLRHREATLTPVRNGARTAALRPGVSVG
jgi:SAM-dependent methyltransferase